jgi:putative Holliday junction resolvase
MRILGIDYGDKRVGLAISDEGGEFAFPVSTIKNSKYFMSDILEIIKEKGIEKIVVGESLNFLGEPNVIMKDIEEFCENLAKKTKIPIIYEPEFLTSVQSERFQGLVDLQDASAAALILQSYLDRDKNFNNK